MQIAKLSTRSTYLRWGMGLGAIFVFLVSIQLLKSSVAELGSTLQVVLAQLVRDDLSALGASWLAAYLLLNGSVVAALALSLYNASLITATSSLS